MKKIKALFIVLLMFFICFTAVGCVDDDVDDIDNKVTITFYHTMNASSLQPILDDAIKRFEAIYPNVQIVHSQEGGYDDVKQKIVNQISIGEQPNIAYCYPDHVALYNKSKTVLALDDFIASTEPSKLEDGIVGLTEKEISNFIPGYYAEGKQFGDGKMYTIPFSKSTEVLYYNINFFTENNLSVPTHWFSIDDNDTTSMEYVVKKIKELKPESIPLGYDSESNWFITMCEQLNSGYTDPTLDNPFLFNNEKNKEFMKTFHDWYVKGYMTTQNVYGKYTSELFKDVKSETKAYMCIGSSAGASHQIPEPVNKQYPFQVGIAPIPQIDANKPKVISQGPSVCIFDKSEEENYYSWLFVKFLTTDVKFQSKFSMASGYVPVITTVNEDEDYKKFIESANNTSALAALSAKVCLEQEAAYFTSPAFFGSSTARDEVGLLFQAILVDVSTGDALNKAIDDAFNLAISNCLAKIGKKN